MMRSKKLVFEITEDEEMYCLNLNGELCLGYMKPFQKDKKVIIQEWLLYIKGHGGVLIDEKDYI